MTVLHRGDVAVVTGAGSGIGRATALALAGRGLTVICADLSESAAADIRELITGRGGTAFSYQVDVADVGALELFADRVAAEHGVPSVVVNNAGIGMGGPFLSHTAEDWRRIVDVNLLGVVHGARLFGAQMAERGEGGHIVNLASAAAFTPSRTLPAYGATKAAVLMLSESIRADLRRHRIGVSAICPGFIATGIYATSRFTGVDAAAEQERRDTAQAFFARVAPGPEVVAAAILHAIERNRAVVPVTASAHVAYVLAHVAPGLMRLAARLGDDATLDRLRPLAGLARGRRPRLGRK
jgi:NAD(P)-dependent dehydrogenase (short-subunit alcohol dehydrogenase family)